MVVAVAAMDSSLSERAAKMREASQKSQTITDNVVQILGSFDSRLSALETAMRPTQIRTHAIRKAHENIDKTLKAAEVLLAQFDASKQAEAKILKGPHEDLESYLEAIDQLRSNINFFSSTKGFKSNDVVLNNANNLLTKAISKLEDEFKQLLASYSKPVDLDRIYECLPESIRPSVGSPGDHGDHHGKNASNGHSEPHNSNSESASFKPLALIPPRILPLLHDLAQQMVQAGHQQQLLKTYRDTRSSVLEESLRKLGVEKLSKEDVQKMQWEVLEAKIGNWIHFMRIAVKILFTGERRVCDQIFGGFDSLRDQCFAECTPSSVSMLLSFGEAISKSKRSPEKLFVLLDMYEIMRELHSKDLNLQQCVNETYCLPEMPKVVHGLRGSTANIYLDNAAYREFLFREFGVSTVDEESAAVVMTCLSNGVPSIVFRGVSDLAGGETLLETSLSSLASINAFIVAVKFMELIGKEFSLEDH